VQNVEPVCAAKVGDGQKILPFILNLFKNKQFGWVAQSVEQRTENPCVGGSIPPPATIFVLALNEL
jgi:hypothetical protein